MRSAEFGPSTPSVSDVFGYLKRRRRRRRMQQGLSANERSIVEHHVPYVRYLPALLRHELEGLVAVFLAEKSFEGCGGLEVTEDMRLVIAAQACLLLLGRGTDVYPLLSSVLIYPGAYVAEPMPNEDGLIEEAPEERIGESWGRGSVVLSWEDVDKGSAADGVNVVFHEFAHQLDHETGTDDGTPRLSRALAQRWRQVMSAAFEELIRALDRGEATLLDEYGAESAAEFFAVVTETFFELPGAMRARHPELYALLADFYRQDPASWLPARQRPGRRVRRHRATGDRSRD